MAKKKVSVMDLPGDAMTPETASETAVEADETEVVDIEADESSEDGKISRANNIAWDAEKKMDVEPTRNGSDLPPWLAWDAK